ncbi:hypothetical protein CerSpe_249850 [Prunus speciosa]
MAYKEWLRTDKALLSLLIASLCDEALEYVIGSTTAREAWLHLFDSYASVSRVRINHLKTELQTAKKSGDSIERFLLRLKHIRDQLNAVGIKVSDDDFVIVALNGLPTEYDIIKTVLIARDSLITLKDFRAQLLAAEQTAEARVMTHTALYTANASSGHSASSFASGSGLSPTPSSFPVAFMGSYDRSVMNSSPPLPHVNSFGGFHSSHDSGSRSSSMANSGPGRFHGALPSNSQFRSSSSFRGTHGGGSHGYRSHVVPECQICCKRGHTATNCYYRNTPSSTPSTMVECQICGK